MSEIMMGQVTELADAKLRKLAVRVAREAELAIEKVAANRKDAAKFPLAGDAKSIERILSDRFSALKAEVQDAAATRALQRLGAPTAVRAARFGDLIAIDVHKAIAVDAQARALPFPAALKFPLSHLQTLAQVPTPGLASVGLVPQTTTDKLELRIHKVTCLDETNGFLGSEAGDDEIDLGGTTVDESGDAERVTPFRVGSSFDDGESKAFAPPKRFTTFDLTEGTLFPKSYFVTLVLAEVDMGGLPEFINRLLNWVKERVIAVLTAAIGAAIGASGGPIGALIGTAVGFVVGLVFDLFKSIWEDDIFKPATVWVRIPSLTARWPGGQTDGPQHTVTFSGHGGKYELIYDWRMFA